VPFKPGRTDATAEMSDAASFDVLEPKADGFRNYLRRAAETVAGGVARRPCRVADLDAPEMAVLVGGLRVLNANYGGSKDGVFTEKPGALTNDFFRQLLDMGVEWKKWETNRGRRPQDRQGQMDGHRGRLVFATTNSSAPSPRSIRGR